MECIKWNPVNLDQRYSFNFGSYALIILNTEIIAQPSIISHLWNNAVIRCTVDGGTNRWFSFLSKTNVDVFNKFPDIVSGDFDSIEPEIKAMCESNGCLVVETEDQDFIDFQKAIDVVSKQLSGPIDSIVTISESTGRIDQTLSCLNTLRIRNEHIGNPPIYLMSGDALTWHLVRGKHEIKIPQYLRDMNQWCGILPFEPKENSVTTTGLKWNLNKNTIKFGGMISSSNTYDGSDTVTITTDSELLWTMGF